MKFPCLLLAMLGLALGGCIHSHEKDVFHPTRAVVDRHFDRLSRPVTDPQNNFHFERRVIADPATVQKLTSFFPDLGGDWEAPVEASYMPWVEITFDGAKGRSVKVSTDYVYWTQGKGDRRVNNGFGEYIDQLFGVRTTAPSTAPATAPAR